MSKILSVNWNNSFFILGKWNLSRNVVFTEQIKEKLIFLVFMLLDITANGEQIWDFCCSSDCDLHVFNQYYLVWDELLFVFFSYHYTTLVLTARTVIVKETTNHEHLFSFPVHWSKTWSAYPFQNSSSFQGFFLVSPSPAAFRESRRGWIPTCI